MSEKQFNGIYKKIIIGVIVIFLGTIISNVITVFGTIKKTDIRMDYVEKRLDNHIDRVEEDGLATENYVREKIEPIREDIRELKAAQNRANDLLWEINEKID